MKSLPDEFLHDAAKVGDLARVRTAFRSGASPLAARRRTPAFVTAAGRGHLEVVRVFLEQGAPVDLGIDTRAGSALVAAAHCFAPGTPAVCRLLLEHGADVEAICTKDGITPLTAVFDESSDVDAQLAVLDLLLEHGANVEHPRGDGFRPLQLAASREDPRFCRRLLEAGADLSAARVGHPDVTAWTVAEFNKRREVLAELERWRCERANR